MTESTAAGCRSRRTSAAGATAIALAAAVVFASATDSTGQQPVQSIWAGDATMALAHRNREAIEAQLADGGRCELPAGVVAVDAPPRFTSGCTLIGHRDGSVLRNLGPGPAIKAMAPGLGYTAAEDIAGPVQVGDWVFRYPYGKWDRKPRSVLCRVVRVEPDVQTEPAGEAGDSFVRFRRAWPCGRPAEGADTVTLSVPPEGITPGQWVYVTDGPSADACRGEFRRVVGADGPSVRLDAPLRMGYGPAALTWVEPLVGVTVRDVKVEAQPNTQLVPWTCLFKGTVNLRLERCEFNGLCDVITSSGTVIADCRNGPIHLNTATECRIERCRHMYLYAEEETQDVAARDCVFGHNRPAGQNCVTAHYRCRRFRFHDCRIIGAGSKTWPPPSAFNLFADDSILVDTEVADSIGGWTLLGGERLVVRGFRTDGAFQVLKARGASLAQIRGPFVELVAGRADDGNRIVDANNVMVGLGWQAFGVGEWKKAQSAPKSVPKETPKPKSQGKTPPKP